MTYFFNYHKFYINCSLYKYLRYVGITVVFCGGKCWDGCPAAAGARRIRNAATKKTLARGCGIWPRPQRYQSARTRASTLPGKREIGGEIRDPHRRGGPVSPATGNIRWASPSQAASPAPPRQATNTRLTTSYPISR